MGRTPQGRTGHRKIPGATHRHPPPNTPLRRGAPLPSLFPDQSRAYALPGVPRPRLVHFLRRCRGWMQGGHWHAPQTRRCALDQARLQRHHCSPLLQTECSFSRLLGAPIRTQGRMTHHFLGVHPFCCKKTRHGTGRRLRPCPFPLINGLLTSMSPFADISECRLSLTFWIVAVR